MLSEASGPRCSSPSDLDIGFDEAGVESAFDEAGVESAFDEAVVESAFDEAGVESAFAFATLGADFLSGKGSGRVGLFVIEINIGSFTFRWHILGFWRVNELFAIE